MELDIESLRTGLNAFKEAISSIKLIKDILPEGKDRDKIEENIKNAENLAAITNAKIAQSLDYHLCKCTYPPQIMLSIGIQNREEKYKCPSCGKIEPIDWEKPKVITNKKPSYRR